MKGLVPGTALTLLGCLALPAAANGPGGHGGGGHGGGHASGGRASGGSHGTAARGATRGAGSASQSGRETARGRPRPHPPGTVIPHTGPTAPHIPPRAYVPYSLWPYYGGGLSLGLGFDIYNDPYGYGASSGLAVYPYDPTWAASLPLPPAGFAPYPFDRLGPSGGLRLRVKPKDAEVFVDGYYAGVVDEFDGHFQHLDLVPGPHHVEVRAEGHEPLQFDVTIQPDDTIQYQGRLIPSAR